MPQMNENQQVDQDQKPNTGKDAMQNLWDQAAEDFETICGKSLRQGRVKTFDDVQKVIQKDRSKENYSAVQQQDGWEKAKLVGLKSLQCLKLLANVAAQGASLVPIPSAAASFATSALGFVFDIPQAIKGYNDAVNSVFEEISSTLAQMRIYESMENIDESLLHQIHLVMVSFVRLSAHVVKYQQGGKRERALQKLKSVFQDDSGLADEMAVFKRVLQQHRDVESTVTLAVAVETHAVVVETQQGVQSIQNKTESMQQDLQSLRTNADNAEKLTIIKDTLELVVDTSTETRARISEGCYKGTGLWIWTHEAYAKWTASKDRDPRSQVLFVSGPLASGKTSACAQIVERLGDPQDRTHVAHYFFPKKQESKKQDSDGKRTDSDIKQAVELALKFMAYQIAGKDAIVRNALYNACHDRSAFRHAPDLNVLWEKLRIGGTGSRATYYFVFDGLENLARSDADNLIEFIIGFQQSEDPKSTAALRFLASGKREMFESAKARTALHIRMDEENQPDMRIFISKKLQEQDILQDSKPNSDQQKVRDMILDRLPQNSKGSYTSLDFGLEDIIHRLRTRVSIKDLERKLEQPISSHEAAIETLQRSLSGDDVNELNELLKWVYPFDDTIDSLSLQELEAAMFLSTGAESLVSLQNTIKSKYSTVLKIEGGDVHVQDVALDFLRKDDTTSAISLEHRESATISMTITIKNVDIETCGNFLWDLAHKANREKFNFGFEAYQASNSRTAKIAVDELEAHHHIVLRAFQYLKEEPKDRTSELGSYLICWLPDHLAAIRRLQEDKNRFLKPQESQEIGQNLYTLFKDATIFERHSSKFETFNWGVKDMNEIREWLTDTSVMRAVQDKAWRNQVKHTISPANGYLRFFARRIVESLLRRRGSKFHIWWVVSLRTADEQASSASRREEAGETGAPDSSTSDDDTINWSLISDWCRDFLKLSEPDLDSLWYERLASLALLYDDNVDEARRLFQLALEKEKPSWLSHRGLGTTYDREEKFAEAMECYGLSLAEAQKDEAEPKPEQTELFDLQLLIGRCALEAGDSKKAVDFYLKARSSEDEGQVMQAQLGHMKAVMRSPDSHDATKWLQDRLAEESTGRRLHDILKMAAKEDDNLAVIPKMFTFASEKLENLKGVVRAMETAIARPGLGAESPDKTNDIDSLRNDESVGVLKYYLGLVTYIYRDHVSSETVDHSREALRLWEECRDQLSNIPSHNAYLVGRRAKSNMAQHYFDNIVGKGGLDDSDVDRLAQLAKSESQAQGEWYASGYLSALYAYYEKTTQSRLPLRRKVRLGLEVLSDETPQNDYYGFDLLWESLAQHGDYSNAATALSLFVSRDILTSALTFSNEDVQDTKDLDKEQVLTRARRLAEETLEVVKSQVPATSPQQQRISAAREHIGTRLKAISPSSDDVEGSEGQNQLTPHHSETLAAYRLIEHRLSASQGELADVIDWNWSCDGRAADGKACPNREFYHCVYCPNIDFCDDCLGRLRGRERFSDMEFTVCSSRHRWLKLPLPSSGFYVGPAATSLRIPEIRPRQEDHQILEVSVAGEATMDVKDWRAGLAEEWGIVLEGGENGDN